MSINIHMQLVYKGHVYEAVHTAATSPLNLEVISHLHNVAEYIGRTLNRMLVKNDYNLNEAVLVIEDPPIYLEISDEIKVEAQMEMTPSNQYIISINSNITKTNEVDDGVFINIIHEVAHVIQREYGINPSESSFNVDGNVNNDVHFNDPTELNAYILSVISLITYNKNKLNRFASMPFDVFYKEVLHILHPNAKNLFDTHMTSGDIHSSTKSQLMLMMSLIHKRLRSGYFSHLPRM